MENRDDIDPNYFEGVKYMRGYGIKSTLTSVGRFLLPIASNLMDEAKQTLARTTGDWLQGKSFTESARDQGIVGLKNIGKKVQQCGKGKRRRRIKKLPIGEHLADPIFSGPEPPKNAKIRRKDYLDV